MRRSKSQPKSETKPKKGDDQDGTTPKRRWSSKLNMFRRRRSNINPDGQGSAEGHSKDDALAGHEAQQIGEALDALFTELHHGNSSEA